jgi:hypothetical protein
MAFWTRDRIRVYERADWHARPPKGTLGDLGPLRTFVVHHGGPVGRPRMTYKTAVQTAQSWQDYHMDSNEWLDIGYHFLMDGLGRLYLGRPASKLGAHVLNENTGRLGLNYMQDGRFYGLTRLQKQTTRKLFERDHPRLGLPALKALENRPGDYGILGHREVPEQQTECPGRLILTDLHAIIHDFRNGR